MDRQYLLQLLLPLTDNQGAAFDREQFAQTRKELIDRFGGMTAYQRAPARGLWKADDGAVVRDEVVVFEVMTADLDEEWWCRYRTKLEERFRQDTMVVRAVPLLVI